MCVLSDVLYTLQGEAYIVSIWYSVSMQYIVHLFKLGFLLASIFIYIFIIRPHDPPPMKCAITASLMSRVLTQVLPWSAQAHTAESLF